MRSCKASRLGQHLSGDEARDAASHDDAVQQALVSPRSRDRRGRIDARPVGNRCRHREGDDRASTGVALLMQCMLPKVRTGAMRSLQWAALAL